MATSNVPPIQHPYRVLLAVAVGTFMATLDASSVNVALPSIARDFGLSIAQVSWVSLAYYLAITSLLLTAGRLADRGHRATHYWGGMLLFALGSLLCALAPSFPLLVAARALEALGASSVMANSPALLVSAFPAEQRGRALGTVTLISTLGSSLGPTVGGLLTNSWGWHSIFWVNVPVGVLGAIAAMRVLARVPQVRAAAGRFDRVGAALSMVALGVLVLALRSEGVQASWTLTGLATGLALIVGFVAWEWRQREPLMQPRLFLRRAFASATAASFLSFWARAGAFFLLPFYFERLLGYAPSAVGFMMTSFPLAVALVAPLAGAWSDRLGTRGLTVAGQLISAGALAGMATLGPQAPVGFAIAAHALLGVGAALFTPPNNSAMLGAVAPEELGLASGLLAVMRNFGLMVGTGVVGLVMSAWPGDLVGGLHGALALSAAIALLGALVAGLRQEAPRGMVPAGAPGR